MVSKNLVETYFNITEHLYPRISPDGERVALFSDQSGRHELYVADLKTGTLTQLSDGEPPSNPTPNTMVWASDGESLYVMNNPFSYAMEGSEIATPVFRITCDGTAEQLFTLDGNCHLWDVNNNTEHLYYQYDDGLHYYDPAADTHEEFPLFPSFCHIGGGGGQSRWGSGCLHK